MKQKYPIYSDTHFNLTLPWTQYNFITRLKAENPDGLILTGDISCGLTIENILTFLAKQLKKPIYFVAGNHDYYSTSFDKTHEILRKLCSKNPNLVWMTDLDYIQLSDDVGMIGDEGWYDGTVGDATYLNYNLDWIMISDFRKLKSFDAKLEFTRKLASDSVIKLRAKLEKALEKFKVVYILTHVPPWAEAGQVTNAYLEDFWKPYNTNTGLGSMIEEVMKDRQEQKVTVFSGHTHHASMVHVAHNIDCIVQAGKYLGTPTEHNCLFI